ncbi:MAG: alanine racemase [Dactylosporangium sp.]|nr:alanine racemase [Dactylosporangium sp.]
MPPAVRSAILATEPPRCAYVYDRAVLRARARALRDALPAGSMLLYAVKANGHPEVLAALADVVDGFEVASGGELALARAAARPGQPLAVGGPGKTDAELRAAVAAGATVNVESALELRRLAVAAQRAGRPATATLRVNRRDAALPGSHAMTGEPTPFGIDEQALGEVVALARDHPAVALVGFSLHAVSNNLDAAAHARFVTDAVAWSQAAAQRHGVPLSLVNVGGGFGVSYTSAERFDLATFARELAGLRLPAGARLVVEPGRYLAAEAGWYAAEVLDLKRTHGRWFAVLRGGTHHFRLPAAWGYSHPFAVLPVDAWPHPYPRPEVRDVAVDAVGELCTPRDVLTRGQPVARLRVGDVVVFGRTGAYGWEISHHDFLRHDPPAFHVVDTAG